MSEQKKWNKRLSTGVVALALAGFLVFLFKGEAGGRTTPLTPAAERKPISGFALPFLDGGGTWNISDYRGKVVLINFWASWCPPCREETSGLVRLANQYRDAGLEVAGVAMDEGDLKSVRQFVVRYRLPYPILIPSENLAAQIESLPTTLLIDRQGRVAQTYEGEATEQSLRADIERLLAGE